MLSPSWKKCNAPALLEIDQAKSMGLWVYILHYNNDESTYNLDIDEMLNTIQVNY